MKSKISILLTSIVLLLSIFFIPLGSKLVLAASKEGIVTANTLNVRANATTSSKKLGTLKKGATLTIIKQQKNWTQVKYGSTYGWVSSAYMNEIGYVTASSLYLRTANNANSSFLATLKKGTAVQIKSTNGSWQNVYVISNKKTGWVSKSFISSVKPETAQKAAVSPTASTKYYVTANSLNIRNSASLSAKVITTAKKGDAVTYYTKSANWAKVKTASNITGWASMSYLSKTKPVITNPIIPKTKTYYVTASFLNVRSSGSTDGDVLLKLKKGDAVTYYSQKNNWANIKTKSGITGWVSMAYLSLYKPTTEPQVNNGGSNTVPTGGLAGKIIVVDAGHGGKDPGASGQETKEKDLTLSTVKKLAAQLKAAGATVILTRSGDTYPSLSDRVQITKNNHADLFISIHFNVGAPSASGIETYYWTTYKNEKDLASYVQDEVINSTGSINRGVKQGNFQVIRENNNLAILIELGFISNPNDEKIIETSSFQEDAATGIVNGLEAYFDSL